MAAAIGSIDWYQRLVAVDGSSGQAALADSTGWHQRLTKAASISG
jgi:hypothetical protein